VVGGGGGLGEGSFWGGGAPLIEWGRLGRKGAALFAKGRGRKHAKREIFA